MWLKPWRIIKSCLTNSVPIHKHTHMLNVESKWTICMHTHLTLKFNANLIFELTWKWPKINILPLIAFSLVFNYRIIVICILLEYWMGCIFSFFILFFHLNFGISFHFISWPTANVMKNVEMFHVPCSMFNSISIQPVIIHQCKWTICGRQMKMNKLTFSWWSAVSGQ